MRLLVVLLVFVSAHCLLLAEAASQLVTPSDTLRRLESHKYRSYMSFAQMEQRIKELEKTYPTQLKVKIAGKSVEGKNIYLVIITQDILRSENRIPQTNGQEDNPQDVGGRLPSQNFTRESSFEPTNRIPYIPKAIVFPSREWDGEKDPSQPLPVEEGGRGNGEEFEDEANEQNLERGARTKPGHRLPHPANRLPPSLQKPVIFVDGGIHAREWVSPAAAFYLIDQLVKTPSLTADLEWRVMPMVNPDGYIFSHKSKSNRMWRKNRAKTKVNGCPGVDLNRNFDVKWENTNRWNHCSETFSGTGPFSEPESSAIRDELQMIQLRLEAYVTLHTYGQLFLYPYGYSKTRKPHNLEKLKSMGDGMAKVIYDKYRNTYRVTSASVLGAAAGGSDDWAYMEMGATYSYTFELQDKVGSSFKYSSRGFQLASYRLPQAVDECWLALKYMGDRIIKEKGWRVATTGEREEQPPTTTTPPTAEVTTPLTAPRTTPPTTPQITSRITPHTWLEKRVSYPVGWLQVMKEVRRIQAEVKAKSGGSAAEDCVREGNLFVCPHMVFWGSMFTHFRS